MGRCVYGGIYEPATPGGRGRSSPRRPRAHHGSSASPWCATPAATSSRATGGRTASARARSARPARPRLALASRPTRSASTSSCVVPAAPNVEPMMAVNLGTRGVEEACDLLEYATTPAARRYSDLRAAHGARGPHNIRCGASATRWTGPGRSATRPPTSTAGSPPRPPRRCGGRPRPRARRLRQLERRRCRPSGRGRRRARRGVRLRRLHLAARLLRAGRGRPRQLPRVRAHPWTTSSRA